MLAAPTMSITRAQEHGHEDVLRVRHATGGCRRDHQTDNWISRVVFLFDSFTLLPRFETPQPHFSPDQKLYSSLFSTVPCPKPLHPRLTDDMSGVWNEQLEKLLLISIIEFPDNVSREKFEKAAARLGNGINWNACR